MIVVKNVGFSYAKQTVLKNINVEFPSEKVTALIGPNGAGKSTLLNLVAQQSELQAGKITLSGDDVSDLKPRERALRMAVVAQQIGVASRLRVRDLISFGRWPQHQGRPTVVDKKAVEIAIDEFELQDIAGRFLDEISGGQRQRAFVAMAYAQDTPWLLLDEPLNNLDIRHASLLMKQLRALVSQKGKSIAMVIHDLNYAISAADHIIALKDGQLAFAGDTRDVATSRSLSELYDSKIEIVTAGEKTFAFHHHDLCGL
ncbi:UNVERIFIED_CONTAM: hypothetical protein GTU68_006055 [Idotea baltica]|nr:hypothetical protein [Idotea baltica]